MYLWCCSKPGASGGSYKQFQQPKAQENKLSSPRTDKKSKKRAAESPAAPPKAKSHKAGKAKQDKQDR